MHWMVEHASHLLSKYAIGPDGRTGYGRLHGKEVSERICEFGERVLHYIPRKLRANMDARWKYGVFLGKSMNSDQNFIGMQDGSVTTSRAMVRLIPSARWSIKWVEPLVATPSNPKGRKDTYDHIEEGLEPHQMADAPAMEEQHNSDVRAPPRLKIMLPDLQT